MFWVCWFFFLETLKFDSQRAMNTFFPFIVHCREMYVSVLPAASRTDMMPGSPVPDRFPEPEVEKKDVFTCLKQLLLYGRWMVFLS